MADELEEVADNLSILIQAGLEVQHRLSGHPVPAPGCPVCDAHRA